MDSSSFDRLTRLFVSSGSRRTLGGVVLGSLAGLLDLGAAAAAHCPKGKKHCGKRCIPKRACCTNANCRPAATGRVCRDGTCQCPPARPKKCNGRCIPKAQCCGAACNPPPPCGGADFQTNVQHCGSCGNACPTGGDPANDVSCVGGKCRLTREFATPNGNIPYDFTAPLAGTLTIVARGGEGGDGGAGQDADGIGGATGPGARGTRVTFSLGVTAGEQFDVYVGGAGEPGNAGADGGAGGAGGAPTGGEGGGGDSTASDGGTTGGGGGGGGGASAVIRPPVGSGDIVVFASGGGGGGGGGGAGVVVPGGGVCGGTGGTGGQSSDQPGTGGSGGVGGDGGCPGNGEPGEPGEVGGGIPAGAVIEADQISGPGGVTLTIIAT